MLKRHLINVPRISLCSIIRYRCISFNHYVLMCCAASLEHLSYPTCVPRKRPEKITLHLRNVCYKISQLDKNNFKDASFCWPSASPAQFHASKETVYLPRIHFDIHRWFHKMGLVLLVSGNWLRPQRTKNWQLPDFEPPNC